MTDKTPEEVLAEALRHPVVAEHLSILMRGGWIDALPETTLPARGLSAAILAAMPDYTLVRKDELERLQAIAEAAESEADHA